MSSREEFNNQLKEAVKSKDQIAVSTIRLILAALKDRDIAAKSKGNTEGISETEIMSLLQSMIKQRNESIRVYRDAGRDELAEREEAEVVVIEKFLPKQLDENEMRTIIDQKIAETGANDIKDMGKVMNAMKTDYAGQMDMSKAGALVKEKLAS